MGHVLNQVVGQVCALSGINGAEIWKFSRSVIMTSPAIGKDGSVYFGANDKTVYSLNGTTGKKNWETSLTSEGSTGKAKLYHFQEVGDQSENMRVEEFYWIKVSICSI